MHRREFILAGASTLALPVLAQAADTLTPQYNGPIVDCHVHIFDPSRPQGVPWPTPADAMYIRNRPEDYEPIVAPLGVVGAIAVEASPWRNDNFWLLDQIKRSDFMLGFVGNLLPGTVSFADDLEWLAAEKVFLGIRYGNLWNRDLAQAITRPAFIADLRRLQQADRTLDTANPDPRLIHSVLKISDAIPDIRIVIDHLPNATVTPAQRQAYEHDLRELGSRKNVFMKLSEIEQKRNGIVDFNPEDYRSSLDMLWDIFGEDRIVFGSDYPNSIPLGKPEQVFALARGYLAKKSQSAQGKVFFGNSENAYKWRKGIQKS